MLVFVLSGIVIYISCKKLDCLNGSKRNAGTEKKEDEEEKRGLHEEGKEKEDDESTIMVNPSCVVEVD